MCLLKLFKKKRKEVEPEVPKKLDFDKYNMRLSIKAICLFERLTGKSFYAFTEEDVVKLIYAIFITSNNIRFKESTFEYLIADEKVAKWFSDKLKGIMDYIGQFKDDEDEEEKNGEEKEPASGLTITSIANSLIIQYGMDPHYVMEEMELWQLTSTYEAVDTMVKGKYEENRLWTYLSILPHVDGKKLNRPDKLLPFPWEAEEKKARAEKQLQENQYAIKNLIGKKLPFIK